MFRIPESTHKKRRKLAKRFESGEGLTVAECEELLQLDPWDSIAMVELAHLREESGDNASAESLLWRAIEAHPAIPPPYIALSRFFNRGQRDNAWPTALMHLALAKGMMDEQSMRGAGFPMDSDDPIMQTIRDLPVSVRSRLMAQAMETELANEPAEVTDRLRLLRLLDEVQGQESPTKELVDKIIAQGAAIAPLLVGLLRDWFQQQLDSAHGDVAAENSVALLGEIGRPEDIEPILEIVDVDDSEVSNCADWALGRVMSRQPEDSVRFLLGSPNLVADAPQRLAVVKQIASHPQIDVKGELLPLLTGGISHWPKEVRDTAYPLVLTMLASAGAGAHLKQLREALRREGKLLSRDARAFTEDTLNAAETDPLAPLERPAATVYDICAGEADWPDPDSDENEPDEEDFDLPPQPVIRRHTPGRNDPCWCSSGKKYKKCHLESDERKRLGPAMPPSRALDSGEFNSLRSRIAEVLRELMPTQAMVRAAEEFFDTEFSGWLKPQEIEPDPEMLALMIGDWVVHDRLLPGRGRTVLEEFLKRHGKSLSTREKEMAEAWARSFVGVYEVLEVKPGFGFQAKNLVTGEEVFVHETTASKSLHKWDGLLTRIVPGERGTEMTGSALTVMRGDLPQLREWIEQDQQESGLEWPAYFKKNWPRVRAKSLQIAKVRLEGLELRNTDGDAFVISKAVYGLENGAKDQVIGRLASFPGV